MIILARHPVNSSQLAEILTGNTDNLTAINRKFSLSSLKSVMTYFIKKPTRRLFYSLLFVPFFITIFTAQASGADFSPRFLAGKSLPVRIIPRNINPDEKPVLLSRLYSLLQKASSSTHAEPIMKAIERLWMISGDENIDILMHNVMNALEENDFEDASMILDKVTILAPDYAEAWYQKALIDLEISRPGRAMGSLQKVLEIDPNHFRALQTLARALLDKGRKKSALKAYRALLKICPQMTSARNAVRNLGLELEGQET